MSESDTGGLGISSSRVYAPPEVTDSLKKKKIITPGLGAPSFESFAKPVREEGKVLKYGSPAYQNKYGGDDHIILKGGRNRVAAADDEAMAPSEPKALMTKKQLQKRKIM